MALIAYVAIFINGFRLSNPNHHNPSINNFTNNNVKRERYFTRFKVCLYFFKAKHTCQRKYEFLQIRATLYCRFFTSEQKRAMGAKRDNEVLLQRRKDGNLTVPYRVIDNPVKLSQDEWCAHLESIYLVAYHRGFLIIFSYKFINRDRVVAVFVQGPAWQFKNWPFANNLVDMFSKSIFFSLTLFYF